MTKQDNTRLVLYTLSNCIYCNDLKGKLNTLGVDYNNITVDDQFFKGGNLAKNLENTYKTESYPILILSDKLTSKILISFISKTDLEEQDGIYIFDTTEQIINKLKEFYEI